MSGRLLVIRAGALCTALSLGLLATGCGRDREAELQRMAECLQTNSTNRFGDGLPLVGRFWVDKERSRRTTVRETLIELGASLQGGKVVDATGSELYFYWVQDPHSRDPRPQRTEEEINELQERGFHVIRMYGPMPKD
jgi:hypothetical protein